MVVLQQGTYLMGHNINDHMSVSLEQFRSLKRPVNADACTREVYIIMGQFKVPLL